MAYILQYNTTLLCCLDIVICLSQSRTHFCQYVSHTCFKAVLALLISLLFKLKIIELLNYLSKYSNFDETWTNDGRAESTPAALWARATNCNSLKLTLWDSDALTQRESSACLRMSARLFARTVAEKRTSLRFLTSTLHTGTDVSSFQH